MIADQHVREQVLDVTQSFLVQAPAGSGKTSLLVQRFLALLARVEQAPEEVLAITFTRKAAAEMRGRIIAALKLGQHEKAPEKAYELKLWELARAVLQRDLQSGWELIDNPARLKIQTIDALSSSIANQMPVLSQFGALPNIEKKSEMLYAQAVDNFLHESAHTVEQQKTLNKLFSHLDNDRSKVKNLLINMLEIREQWLPAVLHNVQDDEWRAYLQHGLELTVSCAIQNVQDNIPDELDFGVLPLDIDFDIDSLNSWLQVVNILLTKEGTWRKTVTVQQGFPAPSSAKNKEEREQLKIQKDSVLHMLELLCAHDSFRQQLVALTKLPGTEYSEDQWNVLDAMFKLLPLLVAHLTTVFRDAGKVDFCAVTMAALTALGNPDAPSDLVLALDCKLRHILIDEFQDTSITQFYLLEKIIANWDPYDGKTLFLVGDPMQSIYRFRKAEVGLFLQAQEQGVGRIYLNFVRLTVNFRSTPEIINWVNQVFAASFPDSNDMTYGAIQYMPAEAATSEEIAQLSEQQAVSCLATSEKSQSAEIIKIIQDVRQNKKNSSIAVLVRAKSHLYDLLPNLRTNNISYQAVEIESLAERPLIQDLLALTKALLHIDDRIAWLAVLRAPWSGLILDDLYIIGSNKQPIWQVLQQEEIISLLSTDGQIRVRHLNKIFASILAQRGRQTIDVQVQNAWHALGGPACLMEAGMLHESAEYFDLLSDLSHKREIYDPLFLNSQLDTLFLKPTTVDENSVQVMTMHKSKGLEFDVIILPSLHKKTVSDEQKLLLLEHRYNPEQYLLVAPIKAATEQQDPIYKYLAWNEAQRQELETMRLLYVAATRAKRKIFCLADVGDSAPAANSLLGKIWPVINHEFIYSDIQSLEKILDDSKHISRLPIDWYHDNQFMPEEIKLSDRPEAGVADDSMRLIGTVAHRIFYQLASEGIEQWDQSRIENQYPVWRQHLSQLGMHLHDLDKSLEILQKTIINAMTDPRGRQILSAEYPESYAEWKLTTHKAQQFSQIILDRAYLDHDGCFWIVDYKVVGEQHDLALEVEKYRGQLYKYMAAVRKLKPGVLIKAGLYFPLQKAWHDVSNSVNFVGIA